MTRRVRLEPEAEEEIAQAGLWYDEQTPGLGLDFVTSVRAATSRLARWPHVGALVDSVAPSLEVRRVAVVNFPYQVLYISVGGDVHVLAVSHDHRRPGYWADRLSR